MGAPDHHGWSHLHSFIWNDAMISTSLRDEWFPNLQKNFLAGLTTSFALVPECIAFALVAQLNPLMGLYGAFIICAMTAIFGGRPGMISGAAGSTSMACNICWLPWCWAAS